MSLTTFQKKAGLIFALAAFVLGVTAAAALGWENEENNKGKEHPKQETPPTVTTPTPAPPQQQVTTPPAPAPTPAPAAAPAPAPAAPQGAPTQAPSQPVESKGAPEQKVGAEQEEQNVPAEVAPSAQPTLAPAVERKQLARTGLDPVVMALLGVFCLAGGGLLFRRAMAH
jgi:outer membrane biosynthesis protein TonB